MLEDIKWEYMVEFLKGDEEIRQEEAAHLVAKALSGCLVNEKHITQSTLVSGAQLKLF